MSPNGIFDMIKFTQGNLLEANVEAVVNTVNTLGIMGKGIALMFKERFPDNFKAYERACKRGEVQTGIMFVTASSELSGPRWIINFPTKKHWIHPSKIEYITEGLKNLRSVIIENKIKTIAIPPLGSGNGGLDWNEIKPLIISALDDLEDIEVWVYEPTSRYQNVVKGRGVDKLTPARALVAEMIRRYEFLGLECSILEVQKLVWFLVRVIKQCGTADPFKLNFSADKYGPYAHELTHLLNALDGSYLHCDKRLADASPFDTIRFDSKHQPTLATFLRSSTGAVYVEAIDTTERLIEGFQSPLGMEALATVDWLLINQAAVPTLDGIKQSLSSWPGGELAAKRKQKLFSDKLLAATLGRLLDSLKFD